MILLISPSLRTVAKIKVQDLEPLIVSYQIQILLFDLYTTPNDKSWCEVRNALKAIYINSKFNPV